MSPPVVRATDLDTLLAAVSAEERGVDLRGVQLHDQGYENVVLHTVDGWILRFPRDTDLDFEREVALLRTFDGRLTVPTPQVAWVGRFTRLMAYPALTGMPLLDREYVAATERERDRVAGSLAEFLAGMHDSLDGAEIADLDVPPVSPDVEELMRLVRDGVDWFPVALRSAALALADELERTAADLTSTEQVLLHNDFHSGNLVLDRPVGRLSGIWDFSCVRTGPAAYDLRYFDGGPRDLLERIARAYTAATGRSIDLRAAVVANRVEDLADAIEFGRRDFLDGALARWAIADAG